MTPKPEHTAVFFHMGPGLHSRIEAQAFSSRFPHVAFLDQPHNLGFPELVNWTADRIKEQYAVTKKPLTLLAHSFGGQLIAGAMKSIHTMVAEVRLMNSAYDPFDCFANLEKVLAPEQARGCKAWKTRSPEDKLHLIYYLAQFENMASSYWFKKENQEAYHQLSLQHPSLNLGTFTKVFTEFLSAQSQLKQQAWKGSTLIYYSTDDQLIQDSSTIEGWLRVFPNAQLIEVKEVGHYGLFESEELAKNFFAPTL